MCTHNLPCTGSLSRWLKWPVVGQAEGESEASCWSLMWVAGVQALGPPSAAFPRPLVGSWIETGVAGP